MDTSHCTRVLKREDVPVPFVTIILPKLTFQVEGPPGSDHWLSPREKLTPVFLTEGALTTWSQTLSPSQKWGSTPFMFALQRVGSLEKVMPRSQIWLKLTNFEKSLPIFQRDEEKTYTFYLFIYF